MCISHFFAFFKLLSTKIKDCFTTSAFSLSFILLCRRMLVPLYRYFGKKEHFGKPKQSAHQMIIAAKEIYLLV